MRFKDKIAIVTGGASGIGKEVATRFVAEGGSVVINGRDAAKAKGPRGMLTRRASVSPCTQATSPCRQRVMQW
jgi:NAD(P)-dependent dehydrogenase (short-subunit alcohol dehydrogenase family)